MLVRVDTSPSRLRPGILPKQFLTIETKMSIVREAYEGPSLIKTVCRKYKVWPSNVRRWKKTFFDLNEDRSTLIAKNVYDLTVNPIKRKRAFITKAYSY
jgi:transposase-like protein